MVPEFQPGASEVDVCDTESVFVHVTVVPAATSSSSGMNALVPSDSAPRGIDTDADDPEPPGVGDTAGDGPTGSGELPPQAVAQMKNADRRTRRGEDMYTSRQS
jgi:hypothetical protein